MKLFSLVPFFHDCKLISVNFCKTTSISQLQCEQIVNPLSANPTSWSNALKQFVSKLLTNCLSVFDHFVILALKGLILAYSTATYLEPTNDIINFLRKKDFN